MPDIDNPRHDQLRQIIQRAFMPRSIRLLEHDIRSTVTALVDRFIGAGRSDIAQDLSGPLQYEVFFNILGMPAGGEERSQLIKSERPHSDRSR